MCLFCLPLYLALPAAWISAQLSWLPALLAIGFPWVYLAALLPLLFCLIGRRYGLAVVPALPLLLGLWQLPSFWGWHAQGRGSLRILTMNCRYFDALSVKSEQVKRNIDACKALWKELRPDVVCTQDWSTSSSSQEDNERAEHFLRFNMGMPYFIYCMPSMACYSRTRFLSYHGQVFPDTYNCYCAVDVPVGGRVVRVYNLHLESYQFGREPTLKQTVQKGFRRFRDCLWRRSEQVGFVADSIARSPYPVVVCGDFNDVPTSYAYHQVLGRLQDGFRKRGRGWGFTYEGGIPGLRIDYIMASPELTFVGYRHLKGPAFLDHRWVMADLAWK